MKVLAEIETRGGDYEIIQLQDGSYRICCDGQDKHGVCAANDVIAWLGNALHNAEFLLQRNIKA